MKKTIFISSVQNEFASERKELANYIREDELLRIFFKPYLFEENTATAHDTAHGTAHGTAHDRFYIHINDHIG